MSSPASKRPKWRRIFIRCLGALIALCVVIFLWRKSLVESVLVQAAESANQQLSFESLETDYWSTLELRGVELHSMEADGDQLDITTEVLRLEFSLGQLLSEGLNGLHSIETEGLVGEVHIAPQAETELLESTTTTLPERLPFVNLDCERLGLHLPGVAPIQIQKLRLQTDPGSLDDLELSIARVLFEGRASAVSANARYRARRLDLDYLKLGDNASLTGFVDLSVNQLAWNLDLTVGAGHLTTSGNETATAREVELQCNSLSLGDLAAFGREPLETDAMGILHASLHAQDNGASLFPAFNGELELLGIRSFGYEVERLTASLQTDEAGMASWSELKGHALLEASGLHIPGAHLEDLDADLRFDGTHFTLANLSSVGALHQVVAQGELVITPSEITVAVEEFRLQHDVTDLALVAPTTLTLKDGVATQLTLFELQGTAGKATVRLDPATPGCIEIRLQELASNGVLSAVSKGLPEIEGLGGVVRACRSFDGWTVIAADLALRQLRFQVAEFDCAARVRCEWEDDRLHLEEFAVFTDQVTLLEANGSVGLGPDGLLGDGPLELSLEADIQKVREHAPEKWRASWPIDGDLNLQVALTGTPNRPRGRITGALKNFALLGKSNPSRTFMPPTDVSLSASLEDALILEEFSWTGPAHHRVEASGSLHWAPTDATGSKTLTEQLTEARLVAQGKIATETLDEIGDWLRDWFGLPSNLRAGQFESEFSVAGTLGSPEVTADFQLKQGTLRAGSLPPINELEAIGQLRGQQLELRSIRGELGAAPFIAAASIDLTTESPTVSATLSGEDLLLVRNSSTKVRADLDVALAGPVDALLLSGSATLAQGRLVSPLEILDLNLKERKPERREGLYIFRFPDAPLKDMRFDVKVRARDSFWIDNNVATGSVRPDLHLTGTGQVPTLAGTLYIDKTLVRLPANNISVRSGSLRFDEANPFFPRIEASANARIKGYEVLITIAGPYDRPEVHLSSTPPLPDEDLILLVLAGQLPGTSAARTGKAAAQSVAVYLATDYLTRWLSNADPEDEASWFDRFDFQTGRDISRSGAETLEASFRIDESRFVEGDALFLTAESDQYDFVNFGLRIVFQFR